MYMQYHFHAKISNLNLIHCYFQASGVPGYNGLPNIKMEDGMSHPGMGIPGMKVGQFHHIDFSSKHIS